MGNWIDLSATSLLFFFPYFLFTSRKRAEFEWILLTKGWIGITFAEHWQIYMLEICRHSNKSFYAQTPFKIPARHKLLEDREGMVLIVSSQPAQGFTEKEWMNLQVFVGCTEGPCPGFLSHLTFWIHLSPCSFLLKTMKPQVTFCLSEVLTRSPRRL